jgi:hypothetical protein
MPKINRRDTADSSVPLIAFDEVTFEKVTFKLSWTVLANLREYVAYVKEATGNDKSPDEVVDKGMQRLFNSDKGFQKWLKSQNSGTGPAKKGHRKIVRTNVEGEFAAGNILNEKLN